MSDMVVRDSISHYIQSLIENHTGIHEIWLFGSQADGNATPSSDWDLLVFADDSTLQQMRKDSQLQSSMYDLFVVHDGNRFEQPWGENPKRGSLNEWKWERKSSHEAEYRATRPTKAPDKLVDVSIGKAYRLWPDQVSASQNQPNEKF